MLPFSLASPKIQGLFEFKVHCGLEVEILIETTTELIQNCTAKLYLISPSNPMDQFFENLSEWKKSQFQSFLLSLSRNGFVPKRGESQVKFVDWLDSANSPEVAIVAELDQSSCQQGFWS
ncbi:hypothetical protein COLO4_33280 [Corchorus olitorius]|uniref:Uncharacterized protein n=1 Tax=Corchorus olitorius TaxID=93759 RepID=A0A1R3GV23_9ROSI|nr:hypothetical protein COLO4_33280 [Corchorus olitorius]